MKTPSRFLLSVAAWVLCIAGLQITANSAGAGFVAPADRLSIAQPRYSGQWKGPDLTVEYRYFRDQGQIDLSGNVTFAYTILMGYTLLNNFRLSAIFVDENGRVLKSNGLVTDRGYFDTIPFHATIKLLPNTAFMAFSYQGDAGGNRSGNTSIWFYPIY